MRMGVWEIIIIVLLVVILFGHNKIPGMMKNLADGLNIFKKEMKSEPKAKAPVEKSVATKKTVSKKVSSRGKVAKKTSSKKR